MHTRTLRDMIACMILAAAIVLPPSKSAAQVLPLRSSFRILEATVTHVTDGDTLTAETKSGTKLGYPD